MNLPEIFNKLISEEILAVLQYRIMSKWCVFYRYKKLAIVIDNIRKQEEEHIEELTQRALELKLDAYIDYSISLDPVAENGDKIILGLTPEALIKKLDALEASAIISYQNALQERAVEDEETRQLFKHILSEEVKHGADFSAELQKFKTLGEKDWLTTLVESEIPKFKNKTTALFEAIKRRNETERNFKF